MAPNADPYRTLGLTRGASLAEVKQAYRRLAKANHPDAAGEASLPRFLAIQAAYDQIAGPGASGGSATRGGQARPPWGADPDRADATRRAYGGRARRTRTGGTRHAGSSQAGSGSQGGADRQDDSGDQGGAGAAGRGTAPPPRPERPSRPPNKATLGSTSYDGADREPFEPDWGGASWYGTTSGTYWTLNPKEYADPRKHGPEYQARARRAAAAARGAGAAAATDLGGPDPGTPDVGAPDIGGPDLDPDAPGTEAEPPTHTTSSWWDATAGPATDAPFADPAPAQPSATVDGRPRWRLIWRVGLAALGWIPIALAIGWIAGEVSGCGRFAATCDPGEETIVWITQLAVLGILVVLASRTGDRPVS